MQKLIIAQADLARHRSIRDPVEASVTYDCHGFTFKSSRLWINSNQVQKILDDRNWMPAAAGTHKVNDIITYRDRNGQVTHSGIGQEVDATGNVSRVRSKWGMTGLYTHDPDDVLEIYGRDAQNKAIFEVRTGGVALKDPPVDERLIPPPLKAALIDPSVSEEVPTRLNDFPIPVS